MSTELNQGVEGEAGLRLQSRIEDHRPGMPHEGRSRISA